MPKYSIVPSDDQTYYIVKKSNTEVGCITFCKHYIEYINFHYSQKSITYKAEFGFYEYRSLVEKLVNELISNYKPKNSKNLKDGVIHKITKWKSKNVGKIINYLFYPIWQAELEKVDPLIRETQKKVFAAMRKCPECVKSDDFYKNEFFVKDLLKYRSAAMLVEHFNLSELHTSHYLKDANDFDFNYPPKVRKINPTTWMEFYSVDGHVNKSLAITLQNIQYPVPLFLLCKFKLNPVLQPITNRTKLITFLCGREVDRNRQVLPWYEQLVYKASPDEIKLGLKSVLEPMGIGTSLRRTNMILTAVRYMLDCGEEVIRASHTFRSLARHSLEYHRRFYQRTGQQDLTVCPDPTVLMAVPPVPLPNNDNITFLATAGAIWEEGKIMEHCVRSYISSAQSGQCYLFHIEWKKEKATAQVSSSGNIIQIHGPRNRKNDACHYAQRILSGWISKNKDKFTECDNGKSYPEIVLHDLLADAAQF